MKPTIITETCTYVDRYGKGHIRYNKKDIALPNLLVGEKAKIDIANSKVIQILEPSKDRVKPLCEKYDQCGGCQLMHLSKEGQKAFKTRILKETFQPLNKIMTCTINDCEMAENPL